MRFRLLPIVCVLLAPQVSLAQTPAPTPPRSPVMIPVPNADPADVASIDAIITALYDVISGPVDKARDWDRMRTLFVPGARLMPTRPMTAPAGGAVRMMEVNDYIALVGPRLEKGGFTEREIARTTEQFGEIAHVFSTYEGKAVDTPTMRGINSIQLLNDGTRWWVLNVFWASERPGNALPEKYLRSRP
jgi:hypothetical protein